MSLSAGLGFELARRLSGEASIRAALQLVLEATLEIPDVDAAGVYLFRPEVGVLELVAHARLSDGFVERVRRFDAADSHVTTLRSGRPIFEWESELQPMHPALREEGLTAIGIVPVIHRGELVAVLNAASRSRAAFDEATRAALVSLAALVGSALARVTTEEALRASEARLQLALEASGQEAWELDLARGEVVLGPVWSAAFGVPRVRACAAGEDPRTLLDAHVHAGDRAAFQARLERALGADERLESEHRVQRADGTLRWVQVAGRVTERSSDGSARRIDGTTTDVTERRALQAKAAEGDRLAALARLAAGIAHEINNPLAYVLANLDFAIEHISQANPALFEGVGSALAEARIGASTVREIVGDLRSLARADDEVDATADVGEAVSLARGEIGSRARLELDLGGTPRVDGSEARLSQVFLNLLLNASQAVPAGSSDGHVVSVRARTDAAGRAVVEVRDTGSGIAAEALPRIFDPYFTTRTAQAGAGLGLSISHAIVATLGGEIEVETEWGRGSCFRVILPAGRARPAEPERQNPEGPASTATRRVLVIDDEVYVAYALGRMLRGNSVEIAGTADEAIERIEADGAFDVIFCDLVMPGVDGPALYERVRARWPELAPRMVFMTGGAFTDRARGFLARVAPPLITKPFEAATVRGIVARARTARPA